MRGGLLCQAGRSNDLHKANGLENLFKPNAMKLASMAEVQPSLCNYPNPSAHWPKVSEAWGLAPISIWALKGATKYKRHDIIKSLDAEAIGPLRGPIRFLLAFPRPHEVSDLCALGLPQVKAAGLMQVIRPARLT